MSSLRICGYEEKDWPEVLSAWNKTAVNRWVYYPLDGKKFNWLFREKEDFSPDNFLLAKDSKGVAGGIIFTFSEKESVVLLQAIFTRDGKLYQSVADNLLEEVLRKVATTQAKKVATTSLSHPASTDIEYLEFLWSHRFVVPGVYDALIECQVGSLGVWMSRDLKDFCIPEEVFSLQKKLEKEGFSFPCFSASKTSLSPDIFDQFPFRDRFQQVVRLNSPLEHFFPVIFGGRVIGGVMVSEPGAPTDWRLYGCNYGLFGPAGIRRDFRGKKLGTVLLFRSVFHLKNLGYNQVLIPTNPTTAAFYSRAGFRIFRIPMAMERVVGKVEIKFKNVG